MKINLKPTTYEYMLAYRRAALWSILAAIFLMIVEIAYKAFLGDFEGDGTWSLVILFWFCDSYSRAYQSIILYRHKLLWRDHAKKHSHPGSYAWIEDIENGEPV